MWKSWDISWKLSWTLMVWIGSYPWLKCQEINRMLKCWNMISKVIAGVRTYTSPYSTQCVVMFETSSGAWEHEEASARMECLVSQANRAFAVCGRICWDVFSFFFSKQANTRLYSLRAFLSFSLMFERKMFQFVNCLNLWGHTHIFHFKLVQNYFLCRTYAQLYAKLTQYQLIADFFDSTDLMRSSKRWIFLQRKTYS